MIALLAIGIGWLLLYRAEESMRQGGWRDSLATGVLGSTLVGVGLFTLAEAAW